MRCTPLSPPSLVSSLQPLPRSKLSLPSLNFTSGVLFSFSPPLLATARISYRVAHPGCTHSPPPARPTSSDPGTCTKKDACHARRLRTRRHARRVCASALSSTRSQGQRNGPTRGADTGPRSILVVSTPGCTHIRYRPGRGGTAVTRVWCRRNEDGGMENMSGMLPACMNCHYPSVCCYYFTFL